MQATISREQRDGILITRIDDYTVHPTALVRPQPVRERAKLVWGWEWAATLTQGHDAVLTRQRRQALRVGEWYAKHNMLKNTFLIKCSSMVP